MLFFKLVSRMMQPTLKRNIPLLISDYCFVCHRIFSAGIFTTTYQNCNRKSRKRLLSSKTKTIEQVKQKRPLIDIWDGISLNDLAKAMNRTIGDIHEAMIVKDLNELNKIDDVTSVVGLLGFRCKVISNPNIIQEKPQIDYGPLKQGKILKPKPPVVTIMGHVDHGKTTLLDALRKSELVKQEFGGITQHIGAFVVYLDEQKKEKDKVTFLDTPGHAAFHSMRRRGADATDIVVLVVALDDGVMEQTVQSIGFANDARVPMIVAINKIDKPIHDKDNSLEYLKRGLMTHGIVLEEDGGDTQAVRVSALKGIGLETLKEAILALAETLQLKAYIDCSVRGVVIESSIHQQRGKLATILVQEGTLKRGDVIWAGDNSWAKVRSMFDEWGNVVDQCDPGCPVQVIGWREDVLPEAGDLVVQLENEKRAKHLFSTAKVKEHLEKAETANVESAARLEEHLKTYKADLLARRMAGIKYKSKRQVGPKEKLYKEEPENRVNLVVKSDVNGSLEVLLEILDSYSNEKNYVELNLVHFGVGPVIESDVELASCFRNTIIYSFNVGNSSPKIDELAKDSSVRIKRFNVIYHLVDDLKEEISEKLPLLDQENVLGEAVVLQEFLINEKRKKMSVAGCQCARGVLKKYDCWYKVVRGEEVVRRQLKVASLRHVKDEVKEIVKGKECGLMFEDVDVDQFRFLAQDKLVCYEMRKVKQVTKWSPPGF